MIDLNLGGIVLSLLAAKPGFQMILHPSLELFKTTRQPDFKLQIHNHEPSIGNLGPNLFVSGKSWSIHKYNNNTVICAHILARESNPPVYTAVLNRNQTEGDLFYHAPALQQNSDSVPLILPPLDEVLTIQLLGQKRGHLFHASAASINHQGCLFAAVSGTGKSTLANLIKNDPEAVLLGDERIAIRKTNHTFQMYGTPWSSSAGVASPVTAPLKAIFILKQGLKNKITPLNPTTAVTQLLIRSFPPFWDAEGMSFTLQFLGELVQSIPCYELSFLPEMSAVEYIRCVIS